MGDFRGGAVLSWGAYGVPSTTVRCSSATAKGAALRGRAFIVAVLLPVAALSAQGSLSNFNSGGLVLATISGVLGAAGAACIIWAFRTGGLPLYVMPLVFGGAPIINVILSAVMHPPKTTPNPLLYVGFLLASIGAGMVLYYRPSA